MQTVLVVDDDPAVRRFIARTLGAAGYVVVAAGRAKEALSLIGGREAAVDLAVIDMAMPAMSGLDLAARLERDHGEIKILFISGYGDSIAMECIARQSPRQVLLKPFSEQAIAGRVEQLLGTPGPTAGPAAK
jgi:CheY-like chemotaxis protein